MEHSKGARCPTRSIVVKSQQLVGRIQRVKEWSKINLQDWLEVVETVTAHFPDYTNVLLLGPLGAGKTTFARHLARTLGIKEPIPSPTFTIMNAYPLVPPAPFQQLVHADLYRIEEESELIELGLIDLVRDPKQLTLVEWPELLIPYIDASLIVTIEYGVDPFHRRVECKIANL